jgi:TonB family protein
MNEGRVRRYEQVTPEAKGRRRFSWAVAASLVAHGAATWLFFGSPTGAPRIDAERGRLADRSGSSEVFVDVLPRQMAESERADNNDVPTDTRFHGERNQVVQEQTRAPKVGRFHAGSGETGTSLAPGVGDESGTQALSMKDLGFGDALHGDEPGGTGMSATDDRLDGIRVGARTLLTTHESKYFSFFARAKRQLKMQWENELAQRVVTLEAQLEASTRSRWTTRVVAVLDDYGNITEVSIVRSSGSTMMDAAAVQAFHRVAVLHNPPKGMFREEGTLLLPWEFNVEMRHSPGAIARSDGRDDRISRTD